MTKVGLPYKSYYRVKRDSPLNDELLKYVSNIRKWKAVTSWVKQELGEPTLGYIYTNTNILSVPKKRLRKESSKVLFDENNQIKVEMDNDELNSRYLSKLKRLGLEDDRSPIQIMVSHKIFKWKLDDYYKMYINTEGECVFVTNAQWADHTKKPPSKDIESIRKKEYYSFFSEHTPKLAYSY